MVFEIPLDRRTLIAALVAFGLLVALFLGGRRTPRYIETDRLWGVAQRESGERGLDPQFVFALIMAESSGNANAQSDVARGLMQLTADTWAETTDLPYDRAFDWTANIAVGSQHLADLRVRLEARGVFSYARLAAAYRYGFGALLRKKFDLSKMPKPRNRIYRKLMAGEIPEPDSIAK